MGNLRVASKDILMAALKVETSAVMTEPLMVGGLVAEREIYLAEMMVEK